MNKTQHVMLWIFRHILNKQLKRGERLPSFREIAQENNVSIFSVKAALDFFIEKGMLESRPGAGCYIKDISEKKLEEVEAHIEEAKSIAESRKQAVIAKNGNMDIVALMISERSPAFYGDFLGGITSCLHREMYHYLLSLSGASVAFELDEVQLFLSSNLVKGFILEPVIKIKSPPYLKDMKRMGIPAVFIGDVNFERGVEYDSVGSDNYSGIADLMEYLVALGHSDIAYVEQPTPTNYANKVRFKAYCDVLERHSLCHQEPIRIVGLSDEEMTFCMKESLGRCSRRPTALVCFNDLIALDSIKALSSLGINVPNDISVCGFDDREMMEHTHPSLTTVRYPRREIGQKAARILIDKISGKIPFEERQNILIKPELIIRNSSVKVN